MNNKEKTPLIAWIAIIAGLLILIEKSFIKNKDFANFVVLETILIVLIIISIIMVIWSILNKEQIKKNGIIKKQQKQQRKQRELQAKLAGFYPHCLRCNYPIQNNETECPRCGIKIQLSPQEIQRQQLQYLQQQDGFYKAGMAAQSFSNKAESAGKSLSKTGNSLTLWITLPIIIIVLILFAIL